MTVGSDRFGLGFADKAAVLAALDRPACSQLHLDADASIRAVAAEHVLVEGDNLEALRKLTPAYFGRVSLVYIDPPYNTGNDFVYRDRFAETQAQFQQRTGQVDALGIPLVANPRSVGRFHSAWLAMMYPRLHAARALLADDGVLMVSIDDNEVHHLRVILDEIFGEDCFIAQVVVVTNRGGRDYLRIATGHEYLLVYGASPTARIRELPKPGPPPKHADTRGSYELRELRNRNPKFHPDNRPNLYYPVFVNPDVADAHGHCAVSLQERPGYAQEIVPLNKAGQGSVWRWGQPKLGAALVADDPEASEVVARRRRDGVFNIYEKHRKRTTKAKGLWDDAAVRTEQGTIDLKTALGDGPSLFDHPKPVALVQRCVQLACDPEGGSIVLDFFAGSGTTAAAVLAQNEADGGDRRVVLVQVGEPTPEGSPAAAAGHGSIADIARARVAALLPEDAGLRSFSLADAPATHLSTEGYLDGLRAAEAKRTVPDPWDTAADLGLKLDAQRLEAPAPWTVLRDGEQWLAVATAGASVASLEALDLPAGATVVVPDTTWSDAQRLALSRRFRIGAGR